MVVKYGRPTFITRNTIDIDIQYRYNRYIIYSGPSHLDDTLRTQFSYSTTSLERRRKQIRCNTFINILEHEALHPFLCALLPSTQTNNLSITTHPWVYCKTNTQLHSVIPQTARELWLRLEGGAVQRVKKESPEDKITSFCSTLRSLGLNRTPVLTTKYCYCYLLLVRLVPLPLPVVVVVAY